MKSRGDYRQFTKRSRFRKYVSRSDAYRNHLEFEKTLAQSFQPAAEGRLPAWCVACQGESSLLVDRESAAPSVSDQWVPNWRERLECPRCRLNTRQRAMVQGLREALNARKAESHETLRLYATEQVTAFFDWVWANMPMECIGSEFLSPDTERGSFVPMGGRDVRHEDVEALSFEDAYFDFLFSNDVLEHVNEPKNALAEMVRVLKPGGELFLSVPFHGNEARSTRRARMTADDIDHLAEPEYHGNPVSSDGSLVFYDFGWDLLGWMRKTGLKKVCTRLIWSKERGYLGEPLFYFHGVKKRFPWW